MNRISPPDKMTILVVDDDRESRSVMAEMLQAEGCRVVQADNGVHALAVLRALTPDLIILDLAMPVVGGCELIHALRANEDLADIPLAVLSAWPEDALRDTRTISDSSSMMQRLCDRPVRLWRRASRGTSMPSPG